MDENKNRRSDDRGRPVVPLQWGDRPDRWTLMLTGPTSGLIGAPGETWPSQPAEYERVNVCVEGAQKLDDIEQYRLQMAGISTAALGYWKLGDTIHPDYETPALRDVAALYAKYDELFKFREKVREMVRMLQAHEWAEDLAATGDAADLQGAITKLVPNQTMHPDDAAVLRWADAMADKMARSRAKGRSGWYDTNMCTAEQLNTMLVDHLGKGDPLDVAILAMMLWTRRERTTALQPRMPGDWTVTRDKFSPPDTIMLSSQKWGGCFLRPPEPHDIGLHALAYRLFSDFLAQADAVAQPDAVDAAVADAIVYGTGAFRVHGDGSTERVDLRHVVAKWTKDSVGKLATTIAEAVAKNADTVPQLTFPHIFLHLCDALIEREPTDMEQHQAEMRKVTSWPEANRAAAEIVAFSPPPMVRDALYRDYAVPAKEGGPE